MGHLHELYDFTASAFIVNSAEVLLIHHKKLNVWLQPGGHIELDEDPEEALYREIEEETGLARSDLKLVELGPKGRSSTQNGKLLPYPMELNVHNFSKNHRHIDFCYLMTSSSRQLQLESEAAHEIGWFSIDAIQKLYEQSKLYEDTLELAKLALKYA